MTLKSLSMNCFRKFKRLQLTFQVVSFTTYISHSAPLGWRSTYFPGGIFPTHSTPQQCYVVIA